VGVVCCQVEVSATNSSLIQRSPTGCGVSESSNRTSTLITTKILLFWAPIGKRSTIY
jgi:hypothetical protein